jgi:hypothetical protein
MLKNEKMEERQGQIKDREKGQRRSVVGDK